MFFRHLHLVHLLPCLEFRAKEAIEAMVIYISMGLKDFSVLFLKVVIYVQLFKQAIQNIEDMCYNFKLIDTPCLYCTTVHCHLSAGKHLCY